jgi:hypothetical protein
MKTLLASLTPNTTRKHKYLSLNNSLKDLPKGKTIALFVNIVGETSFLVFAPVDADGKPTDMDNTVSLELPCPPYCGTGKGGNNQITVVTVD